MSGDLHSHSGLNCEFPLCLCADGENARAQVVFKRATHEIFIGRRCSSAKDGRQKYLLCVGPARRLTDAKLIIWRAPLHSLSLQLTETMGARPLNGGSICAAAFFDCCCQLREWRACFCFNSMLVFGASLCFISDCE